MRKILIPILLIAALGACSKAPESHAKPSEVITSTPVTPSSEDSSTIPTAPKLSYGQSFTYLDGLKITVYALEDANINPANNAPELDVLVEAPNGWMAEEQGSAFKYRTDDGDVSAEVAPVLSNGPFSENLSAGEKKTFRLQIITKDRTGTVILTGMNIPQAEWS